MNMKPLTLLASSVAFFLVISTWITPASGAAPILGDLWTPDAQPMADQDRDRARDGDCDQDPDQDQTQDRDRDGDCDQDCDQDQDRDRDRDGDCDQDQDRTRDRDRDPLCQSALPWAQDTQTFAKRDRSRSRDKDKDCNGDRKRDRRRDCSR